MGVSRRADGRSRWSTMLVAVVTVSALGAPGAAGGATAAVPVPLNLSVAGANGSGYIETPGRTCAEGGQGAYWNYDYSAPVGAGAFSQQPGDLRLRLALHSDLVRFPGSLSPTPAAGPPRAFLQGDDSHASLANSRGTLKVRLRSGTCAAPTLAFDGISSSGSGTWEVSEGQGSYRGATGSGSFTVSADVAPGADNPFSLQLDGQVSVLQPSLKVEVLKAYWGSLGTDYLTRRVTVAYKITNTGPGDAFAAKVLKITSSTPGVTPIGGTNLPLGDLEPGQSEVVSLRFQLGLLGPCQLVILGCSFATTTFVDWSDALDVVSHPSAASTAKAPTLPPPL